MVRCFQLLDQKLVLVQQRPQQCDISSAGSSDDFVVIKDGSNNQKFVVESDGTLTLPTIGSKVGIGTATPSAMLDISSAGAVMIL